MNNIDEEEKMIVITAMPTQFNSSISGTGNEDESSDDLGL